MREGLANERIGAWHVEHILFCVSGQVNEASEAKRPKRPKLSAQNENVRFVQSSRGTGWGAGRYGKEHGERIKRVP